jgi:hypothetical protein
MNNNSTTEKDNQRASGGKTYEAHKIGTGTERSN